MELNSQPILQQEAIDDVDAIIRRNNYKLTADKIKQILSKVLEEPSKSSKRWVWELMQNAKDVPNTQFGRVSIEIILSQDKLVFQHNGDPFLMNNITGLIQQVSSKDSANNDTEVTGKFGTGFISTHLLSEVIDVTGVVHHKGIHRRFKVTLDRSGRTSEELLPKIESALEHIRKIEDNNLFPIEKNYLIWRSETSFDTSFTYYFNSEEKRNAAVAGVEDLINTLPVTLVNIPKIKKVTVINQINGQTENYESKIVTDGMPIKQISVSISSPLNQLSRNFINYSTNDLSLTAEVDSFHTLSLKEYFGKTPNLYRDFPLIGSEKFYFPFILNGYRFSPTEDRDGILLHSKESYDSIENREIVEKAILAALEFIKTLIHQNVQNRYVLALTRLPNVKWEPFSREWYQNLQKSWRKFLLQQELVETAEGGFAKLSQCVVPNYGLSNELKTAFYHLVAPFVGRQCVSKPELILKWIEVTGPVEELETWDYPIHYTMKQFLADLETQGSLKNLSVKLAGQYNLVEWLNTVYRFLIEQNEPGAFGDFAIIPNQYGRFLKLGELCLEDKESHIPDEFLDTLKSLGEDWRQNLIHRAISLPGQNIDKRGLSKASEKINEIINKDVWNAAGVYENEFIKRGDAFSILKDILRNIEGSATGDDFRCRIFYKAKDLFGFEEGLRTVPNTKDFRFDIALKLFIHIIHRKIQECSSITQLSEQIGRSKEDTVIWLNNYLNTLFTKDNFKNLLEYGNIVPNRDGELCAYEEISNFGTEERPLDDSLIDILFQLDSKQNWRKELLLDGINLHLPAKKFDELGTFIDNAVKELEKEEAVNPGTISRYKTPILDLINWCKTYPNLSENYLKHTVLRSNDLWVKFSMTDEIRRVLRDENCIEILNEISKANLSTKDVKKLVEIAGQLDGLGLNGMTAILDHAESLLDREKHFHFMKATGENIEDLFKEALEAEQLQVGIEHQGWGSHDFRIFNKESPSNSLFIEIKSYANGSQETFKFASSQIKKSINDSANYFVCMLERPSNDEAATIDYLKSRLEYRTNVMSLMNSVIQDINDFERIENKQDSVKLIIQKRDRPRVHVDYDLMRQNVKSFAQLVSDIKTRLL